MKLNEESMDLLFRKARTHNVWQDKPVSAQTLHELYELMKWGPTSANTCPARIVFVQSSEAKAKLLTAADAGNVEKIKTAPVTAIIAHDMEFYEKLPKLFPQADAKSWFKGNDDLIQKTAFRNGTLQGAYLILAARGIGLDAGPMSGFKNVKVDELFFAGTSWKSNFLCNLGYGETSKLFPRNPRLSFEEACKIV